MIYIILQGEEECLNVEMVTNDKKEAIKYILGINKLDYFEIQFWENGLNVGDFNEDDLKEYTREGSISLEEFLNENM
jgi:hypothetical protein